MHYHSNRIMFYHQLLTAIEIEANKDALTRSAMSHEHGAAHTDSATLSEEALVALAANKRARKVNHLEPM